MLEHDNINSGGDIYIIPCLTTSYLARVNDEGHVTVHVCSKLSERTDDLILTIEPVDWLQVVIDSKHKLQIVNYDVRNVVNIDSVWHRLHRIQCSVHSAWSLKQHNWYQLQLSFHYYSLNILWKCTCDPSTQNNLKVGKCSFKDIEEKPY